LEVIITTIFDHFFFPPHAFFFFSFVSFCDSRTVANIKETADNIQRQVVEEQEVTRSQLVSHIDKIRIAWKARKEGPPLDSPPTPPVEKSNQNVPMDALETIILDSPMSLSPSCSALVPSISEQEDADFHEQDIEPMEIEYAEPIQEEFTEPVTAPPVHVYTERYKSNSWMSKNHTTQPYLTIYQQRKKAKCIKSKLDFILN
jgi:hypothetical protein